MKKLLSILLVVGMLSALLPCGALADDELAAEDAAAETMYEPAANPGPTATPVQTAAPTTFPEASSTASASTEASTEAPMTELIGAPGNALNDSERSYEAGDPAEDLSSAASSQDDSAESVHTYQDPAVVPSEAKDPGDDQADPENEEASSNRNEDGDEGTHPVDTEEEAGGETTANAAAMNVVASGSYGENLTWTLDGEGKLCISGTGLMRDTNQYGTSTIPWYEYREGITSVVIENGVTSVGAYAFYNCTAMESVRIPESVQSIGEASFCFCSSLTGVTLPDGITAIGREAFIMCSSLTSIVIPSGVTSLDYRAFNGCSSLTSIVIPLGVTTLGFEVFGGCSSLTNVTIPDSVTYIDWGAFSECSSLKNMTIPDSVTYIADRVFEMCSSLTSVTIPDSVTSIGYSVFDRCSALESLAFPRGITVINYGMCSGCGSLTSVTIPSSVTSIEMNAFYNCVALRNVYFDGPESNRPEIKEGNDCLKEALWFYQLVGNETTVTYQGYTTKFGPNELSINSFAGINNRNIAVLCAMLSDAAYSGNGVDLINLFRQMFSGTGFDESRDTKLDYSGGAFCSGIALGKTVINNQETNVLVIVVRGTQELLSGEVIADLSGNTIEHNGYATYSELVGFYTELMSRLNEFTSGHSDIYEKPLKIIVTGHSLGGAGANLLTAMFNKYVDGDSWWAPITDLSDIYGYTYGAIDVINIHKNPGHGFPLHSGYQNIHNVINNFDDIIIFSNLIRAHGYSGVGKYGHMDLFSKNYGDNHKMLNYLNAVATANVGEMKYKYNRIRISCPVDIDVYQSGKLVGRVVNNSVDESVTTIDLVIIGEDKYIFCPEGAELSFQIIATNDGQMEYSVERLSSESYEQKTFSNIALTQGERFESEVGGNTIPSDARLYVINSEGEPVREVLEDGTEVEYHPEITPLFTDVSDPSEYYYDAVYWARDNGITTGRTPTTFDPYAPCTRGQIVTFLWRMMGEPSPASGSNPFTDVKPGDYFYTAVLWAYSRGITTGKTATTFQPYSPCTREQSVTFLWRAAGKPGSGGGNPFGDVKAGTYYYDAVRWAVANGITTGRTAKVFGVGQTCTRAQIVTFLYRYAN